MKRRKKSRARRRSNPKRHTARRARLVANPRPRRRGARRRRNAGGGFFSNAKPVGLALLGALGGIFVGTKLVEHYPDDWDNKKVTMAQLGVAALGGLALYKFSAPAALGVAAGLGGGAAYSLLNPPKTATVPELPEGTTAGVYYGDPYAMGAVETTGALYDDVAVEGSI